VPTAHRPRRSRTGREAAWRVIDAVETISITANLGDAKSTITHPASTTHGRLSAAQREAMSIREGLVRLSVGLEEVEDLEADLARGLALV
jgi:O-succinylhomoserine sulfhydrylase